MNLRISRRPRTIAGFGVLVGQVSHSTKRPGGRGSFFSIPKSSIQTPPAPNGPKTPTYVL